MANKTPSNPRGAGRKKKGNIVRPFRIDGRFKDVKITSALVNEMLLKEYFNEEKKNKKLPQMSNQSGHVAMEHNGLQLGEVAV